MKGIIRRRRVQGLHWCFYFWNSISELWLIVEGSGEVTDFSFCGLGHCHSYIPLHFRKMFCIPFCALFSYTVREEVVKLVPLQHGIIPIWRCQKLSYTVESLFKARYGTNHFVPWIEVSFIWRKYVWSDISPRLIILSQCCGYVSYYKRKSIKIVMKSGL